MKKPKWWRRTDLSNSKDVKIVIITDHLVIMTMILVLVGWIMTYDIGIQLIIPISGIFLAISQIIFVIYKYKKSQTDKEAE